MKIHYASDGEPPRSMSLTQLMVHFNANGGWKFRHNKTDMCAELGSRGWYEGLDDRGHYLVLNLDKMGLAPTTK